MPAASAPPPRTEQDPGAEPRQDPATGPYLFVVLDCEHPLAGASRHALAHVVRVTLGRGAARGATRRREGAVEYLDIRLPGSFVSTTHAHLHRDGRDWVLEDAGSRNGTFLNGERISRAVLRDGDLIEIGRILLRFRAALGGPADTASDLDSTALAAPASGLGTLVPALAAEIEALLRVARSQVPILFLGESGTGKEVLARAVHALSDRPGGFIAVNCGALTGSLLESQLFGHVKGAFTGAQRDEPGFIRAADRGTLFLDEIGDLPLTAQVTLLRVLQEREVVPVGGTRPVKVDLRVLAATHRPLDEMARQGGFRGDLLARLSGYRHRLWPLRDRREDLGLLIGELLVREGLVNAGRPTLSTAAGRLLLCHYWPLNVRELLQCLTVSTVLAADGVIEAAHLPETVRNAPPPRLVVPLDDPEALREVLIELLERHGGKVSYVARDLGKARAQIHRWLRRLGIDLDQFRR
jgi:DNA-binding NtrC family response regulator